LQHYPACPVRGSPSAAAGGDTRGVCLRQVSRRTARGYLFWVRRELQRHGDVSTAMIYVLNRGGVVVRSPADLLIGDPE